MDKLSYVEFLEKKEEMERQYHRFLEENSQYYQARGEQTYLDLLRHILKNGTKKTDRTGTGTISVFGYQMRFDLTKYFPLLTTKKVFTKGIIHELLWFINGDSNIRYLLQHNVHIWTEWCIKQWFESEDYNGPDMTDFGNRKAKDPAFNALYMEQRKIYVEEMLRDDKFAINYGSIGDSGSYGANWRRFAGPDGKIVDQLADVIQQIKNNSDSRRHIVSAWNPAEINNAALPPCHTLFQFYVLDGKLSCQLYQRSGDTFLGIPFNIASYSLLTHMIAQECGLEVGEFVHTIGDAHIYSNHIEQVEEQLSREPRELPTLWLNPKIQSVFDFTYDDIRIDGYNPHPAISAPVAV